jgi:hypothetical protein
MRDLRTVVNLLLMGILLDARITSLSSWRD